jgi:predicted dehydrogenase
MLNRRDFVRLAAATSAAASLPLSSLAQEPVKKIRYAPLGLGVISTQHFMPGTRMSQFGQINGLVSGHPDKAHKFAAEYNVPDANIYNYETFDKIRDNPEIDAVYIGLPNSMHAEYVIRAAEAGKHVLCEKPMATSLKDCQNMIAACRKNNRKLMIAYRCHFQSSHVQARELVRSGAIGKVEVIEGAAGFNSAPGVWRLNKALAGGGPLMDIGVYALNACRFVLGEEPAQIQAFTSSDPTDPRFKEVEENISWTMKFPSGALASMTTTYGANQEGFLRLHGSKGTLEINGFGYAGISLTMRQFGPAGRNEATTQTDNARDPYQFVVESDYFSRCVLDNKEPSEASGEEGLKDIAIMQKIYQSAGIKS